MFTKALDHRKAQKEEKLTNFFFFLQLMKMLSKCSQFCTVNSHSSLR